MKLQPTCSICLSKIKIIDLRHGSRRMGPGRKLLCNHIFHSSCIDSIYKPQCPLCEHPIFNSDEEALLTSSSEEEATEILKTIHNRDINVKNIFTFLTTYDNMKKYDWIVDLMYKYCDFTDLLADNLNDKDIVKEIVSRGKVNWFKTFCGGLTFFDLVYERTSDSEIIDLVHAKLPMYNQAPHVIIPKAPYQRHIRMDSASGAAFEQRLWGDSGPLHIDNSRPSLYPVMEEPEKVYKRLYPELPSAPPLD